MKTIIKCTRCGGSPNEGALLVLRGAGTNHEPERSILCGKCLNLFRHFLIEDDVSRETTIKIYEKQRVAERFTESL